MYNIFFTKSDIRKNTLGFTLVELMVSVSIFSFIMVMSMGAVLSVLTANTKSQTLRSVMDNLNSTLESMTRTIRFGTLYHSGNSGVLTNPADTIPSTGDDSITVRDSSGQTVTYKLDTLNSRIVRNINNTGDFPLTSPDVQINFFKVFVSGSATGPVDVLQPRVVMVIKGTVIGRNGSGTTFVLQTTVSQRQHDV